MLRATFAPFFRDSHATFEVPFGVVARAPDGREVPALRWADLSENAGPQPRRSGGAAVAQPYGLSLLNNGKYGHQAHGNTLGLTLVRASYEPDVNPDEGLHRFTYSLYPHPGDWPEAGSLQRAAELNQPLQVVVTGPHTAPLNPGKPWLAVGSDAAVVSALKLAEDQPGGAPAVVVRLYEAYGRPAETSLNTAWPVASVATADPIERPGNAAPVGEDGIRLAFQPYEIKTILLKGTEQ
jgi:alpha-mannosidase